MPAEVVRRLAENFGIEPLAASRDRADAKTKARQEALGALSGYAVGLSWGVLYGVVRPWIGRVHPCAAGALLGCAAMAFSDIAAISLRATDPKTWGAAGWSVDAIAHLVYGLTTACVFEAIEAPDG